MTLESFYKNRRVLITGHTGFKGSWLSSWLSLMGAHVAGLALPPVHDNDHFNLLKLSDKLDHHEADIRDLSLVQKIIEETRPEIIFHLAAQALVRRSFNEPKTTFDTNVGGAVNLLESIRHSSTVKTLVYVTSDKCYRNKEWVWGYRETDELGGKDPYSGSKACAELVLSSYRTSFFQSEHPIRAASVRAGNIIGGGDWSDDRIIPDCVRALKNREDIVIRNPRATRPWQHVLDPLRGYLLLAQRLHDDESLGFDDAWNFGPDRESNISVEELVKKFIGFWGEGGYQCRQTGDQGDPPEARLLHLNCDKAHANLQWSPVLNIDEAVRYTAEWYHQWAQGNDPWNLTTSQIQSFIDASERKGVVS